MSASHTVPSEKYWSELKTLLEPNNIKKNENFFRNAFNQCFFLVMCYSSGSVLFSEASKSSKSSTKSSKSSSTTEVEVLVLVVLLAEASDAGLRRAEAVELGGGGGVGEAEDQEDEESGDLHAERFWSLMS